MTGKSARLGLPYLYVGQAQKEITHNEALAVLDTVVAPVIEAELDTDPQGLYTGDAGKCWLVDAGATGAWAGHEDEIAYWTGESWRFVAPPDRIKAFRADLGQEVVRANGAWFAAPAVVNPVSGGVVDDEARAAIVAILSIFRSNGLIPA
ncbi:MAG: DUF2793 domain-containing protein [Sphingorhabdus sp.]